ncbi:MAG: NADH-quinone oxidoreductase subunit D [Myxococcota bacterium]
MTLEERLNQVKRENEILLNMGPQHPSTHGVIRFIIRADGEIMVEALPVVGYLHRGIEKLAEMTPYTGFIPYTDRVDYLAAMFANHAFVMGVERLLGIEVPKRAEYLRVIACELNRIASHLIALGSMAMDIGAFTPFLHGLRERELINDIMEMLCGARLTYNYMRIGGVSNDIDDKIIRKINDFLNRFYPGFIEEFNRLITNNEILVKRCINIATISSEEAINFGLVGPNLRASGVKWDLRKNMPYSVYPEFKFDIPVGKGFRGELGDSYDRFVVRVMEMEESAKILRQAISALPDGEIMAKVPRRIKPPAGEVYSAVESARGELGYYIISDGTENPYRCKIRTGSFSAMKAIHIKSQGCFIADLVVLIASMDIVAPEIDR